MKSQKGGQDTIKQIGDYTIQMKDILGSGSFGVVYKCTDKQNEIWAAKQISKSLINGKKDYLEKLLRQEVGVQKQMKSENIVRLKEFLISNNNYYLILDYCNAGNLKQQISKEKRFSENNAKSIMIQIMSGLREMNSRSIVHRDIKPENILVSQTQQGLVYKLADFGFAKILNNQDMIKSQVGTPLYMDPQILLGKPYDSKCDIWSVGIIFYELLYGSTPWPRVTSQYDLLEKIRKMPIRFQEQISVSEKAKSLIKKMLQVEPSKRISYQELFEDCYFQQPQSSMLPKEKQPIVVNNEIQKEQAIQKMNQIDNKESQKNTNQINQNNEKPILQRIESIKQKDDNQIQIENQFISKNENQVSPSEKTNNQINQKNGSLVYIKSEKQIVIKNDSQLEIKQEIQEKKSVQPEQNRSDENYAKLYQLIEFSKQDFEQFSQRMFIYNFGCLDKDLFQQFVESYLGKGDHSLFFEFIIKMSIEYNLVKSPDNQQKVLLEDFILIFKKFDRNFKSYVQQYLMSQNLIQNLSSTDSSEQKKEINQTQKFSINTQSNNLNFNQENKSNRESKEIQSFAKEQIDLQFIPQQSNFIQNQSHLFNDQFNKEAFSSNFNNQDYFFTQTNQNHNMKIENFNQPKQINESNPFQCFEDSITAINSNKQQDNLKEVTFKNQMDPKNNFKEFQQDFNYFQASQKLLSDMPNMQNNLLPTLNNNQISVEKQGGFSNNNLLSTNFCLQNIDKSLDQNIFMNLQKNVENVLFVQNQVKNLEENNLSQKNQPNKIEISNVNNDKVDNEISKNQNEQIKHQQIIDPFDNLPDPLEEYRKNLEQAQKLNSEINKLQSLNEQLNSDLINTYQADLDEQKNISDLMRDKQSQQISNPSSSCLFIKEASFVLKETLLSNNFEVSLKIVNETNKENISDNIQPSNSYQKCTTSLNEKVSSQANQINFNLDYQPVLKNYTYSRNESIARQSQSTNYQSQAQLTWENSCFNGLQQRKNQDANTNFALYEQEQFKNTQSHFAIYKNAIQETNEKVQNNENQISLFNYSQNMNSISNDIPKKENLINPKYLCFYNINNTQFQDLNLNPDNSQLTYTQQQIQSPNKLNLKNNNCLEASPSIGDEASYIDNQILQFTPNNPSGKGYWDEEIDKQDEFCEKAANIFSQKRNFIQNPIPFLHHPNNINNIREQQNPISNDSLSYILFN